MLCSYLNESGEICIFLRIVFVREDETKSRGFRNRPERPQEIAGLTREALRVIDHVEEEAQFTGKTKFSLAEVRFKCGSHLVNVVKNL
jgi:hypothetical protein